MVLFYIGLAGTAISILFMLLGPKEGMESLGVGLVAYFNLLYHLVAGPLVLLWLWRQKRSGALKLGVGLYFAVIYGIGLYGYIVTSELDRAAVEKMAEISEPDSYRLRELGFQLYVSASSHKPVDQAALAEIKALIPRVESINSRTERYRPVLWYLAAVGEKEPIRRLIEQGAVLDDPELYSTSPLYHAATSGHTHIVQMLLDAGADPNAVDHRGVPAVVVAVDDDNLPLLQSLIASKADLDLAEAQNTAFARALRKGRSDIVALLLRNGAKPIVPGLEMPIEWAIAQNDTAMITVLVAHTEGFDAQTENREPVLFQLAQDCDLVRFEQALQLGANPNVRTLKNDNLLARIIAMKTWVCSFDTVRAGFARALLQAGVDVNQKSERGDLPLIDALFHRHGEIVSQLIQAGATFDGGHSSRRGDAMILAAQAGLIDAIDWLQAQGLDLNGRWTSGLIDTNPLLAAVTAGHEATVAHLIERGAWVPDDYLNDLLFRRCVTQAARNPVILERVTQRYLAGGRQSQVEKKMRHWVRDADNAEAALAVLDRLGIAD